MTAAVTLLSLAVSLSAGPSFLIDVGDAVVDQPVDGRLVVYVIGPDRPLRPGESPGSWDFCAQPMPIYATTVKGLTPGEQVIVDEMADWYLHRLNELRPGTYSAMAVLDRNEQASGWDMEPGNLASKVVSFRLDARSNPQVKLTLNDVVAEAQVDPKLLDVVTIKSRLLSDFHGRDVYLRAGVVKPVFYDPRKAEAKYAAIYEVPGFGGRHFDAEYVARKRVSIREKPPSASRSLAMRTFYIVLDPESPNGHTLFADSDVNGPYGKALTEELIPELERRYPLIADANHRIITGHSSGGWATCWLATQYPEVFGAAWASSPDPVDFRRFERVNIYDDRNFYERDGEEIPSARDTKGRVTITLRQEATREEILAKNNASGQQWDSWQAVWGSNAGNFRPKSLWDPVTGEIDPFEAEHYKQFDLSLLLRTHPQRYAPLWRERIRVVVGDLDDYYLNEAVLLLRDELRKSPPTGDERTNAGYIKILPGRTHGSVYNTREMRNFDAEMLDFLAE